MLESCPCVEAMSRRYLVGHSPFGSKPNFCCCSLVIKNKPAWLYLEELKFEAKKVIVLQKH